VFFVKQRIPYEGGKASVTKYKFVLSNQKGKLELTRTVVIYILFLLCALLAVSEKNEARSGMSELTLSK